MTKKGEPSWNRKDRVGERTGILTIVSYAGNDNFGCSLWLCDCDCGKQTITKARKTKSCGCMKNKGNRLTHGMTNTREYKSWCGMLERCANKNRFNYKRYGGRGIKIHDSWLSDFQQFFKDMGENPYPNGSIERIDNNGNYEPSNCRWATNLEQSRNKSTNVFLTFNGKSMCLTDWGKETGIQHRTLQKRLSLGWSVEMTLTKAVRKWD